MLPLTPMGYAITVTVGTGTSPIAGSSRGYSTAHLPTWPQFGSVSPTSLPNGLFFDTQDSFIGVPQSSADFELDIPGSIAKERYFRGIQIQTATGWIYYSTSATSNYLFVNPYTLWRWGTGSSPVWTSSDDLQSRKIIFYP